MDLRTGAAYWEIRNGLLKTYPPLLHDEAAAVAIIGGGVTGALVGHRLAAAGVDVVVIDRRDIATGSTAASTGLLQYETDTPLVELQSRIGPARAIRTWQLGQQAITAIESLCTAIGDPCDFSRQTAFYLASSARDARALAVEYDARARAGFDVQWLERPALESTYGLVAPAAIVSTNDAQIDCFRFTHQLLGHAAARHGLRAYDRTEVLDIDVQDDHVVLHTSRGPRIRAARVVWAAGYESVAETQRRVATHYSTWALATEPVAHTGSPALPGLIWETARPYLYARMTGDGRVVLGGQDEAFAQRHSNERLLIKKTERILARAAEVMPGLTLEVAYRWAGVFSSTKDGLPYIGSVPEHPHAWLAMGYGGNGITFSAIAADLIHDDWQRRFNPDAELFSFER